MTNTKNIEDSCSSHQIYTTVGLTGDHRRLLRILVVIAVFPLVSDCQSLNVWPITNPQWYTGIIILLVFDLLVEPHMRLSVGLCFAFCNKFAYIFSFVILYKSLCSLYCFTIVSIRVITHT